NSQTANAISLHLGLVPEGRENDVLNSLVEDIRSRDNGLTAGDVGYRYVLRALEEGGRTDVIFDMNSSYDKPGYGWQLAHGATALTESWQAFDYKSNNHLMLGHLAEWLYTGLCGLRQADGSVAFRHTLVDPQPVGDITSASATYESPYGPIGVSWCIEDGEYTVDVEIPANATSTVMLPTSNISAVTEYGTPLLQASGVTGISHQGEDRLAVTVGSGKYRFNVKK
ncbi:MAG: alpha-L-rhamnosidase, partial [Muribaculum sp.]|nr:alpha-L-rhamnosidase [Muribaculum sp.]